MASASKARVLVAPLCAAAASRLLRPVAAAGMPLLERSPAAPAGVARCFVTRPSTYYLRGKMLNCSDKSAKPPVFLNGRDFQHWLVVMEPPAGDPRNPDLPRSEIIEGYIDTLAQVVGSDKEAKKLIYSVSTRCYFAFGALVSEELSCRLRELPKVKWVLPDSYLYPEQENYGGEPFINGEAVPYDPKYHLEWLENDYYAKYLSKCNDVRHGYKFESSFNDFDSYLESVMGVKDVQLNINSQDSAVPADNLDLKKDSDSSSSSGSDTDVKALPQNSELKENVQLVDSLDQEKGSDSSSSSGSADVKAIPQNSGLKGNGQPVDSLDQKKDSDSSSSSGNDNDAKALPQNSGLKENVQPADVLDQEKGSLNTLNLPDQSTDHISISDGGEGENVSEEQVSGAKSTAAYEVMRDGAPDGAGEGDADKRACVDDPETESKKNAEETPTEADKI